MDDIYKEIEHYKQTIEKAKEKLVKAAQEQEQAEKNLEDKRFLFALGRELEFKGNLLDGIALISMADHNNYSEDEYNSNDVE